MAVITLPAVAPKLHPGERILYDGHPSWRSILDFYIKGLALTAAVALVAGLVTSLGAGGADAALVTLIAVVGVAVTILAGFVKRLATTYTITDRRLHIKRGIISRTIQETRLERVQNVNYRQSVAQRLLQIGDVDFDTAAGDDYNFIFTGVADPAEVVHMVDRATGIAGADGLGGSRPASEPAAGR